MSMVPMTRPKPFKALTILKLFESCCCLLNLFCFDLKNFKLKLLAKILWHPKGLFAELTVCKMSAKKINYIWHQGSRQARARVCESVCVWWEEVCGCVLARIPSVRYYKYMHARLCSYSYRGPHKYVNMHTFFCINRQESVAYRACPACLPCLTVSPNLASQLSSCELCALRPELLFPFPLYFCSLFVAVMCKLF